MSFPIEPMAEASVPHDFQRFFMFRTGECDQIPVVGSFKKPTCQSCRDFGCIAFSPGCAFQAVTQFVSIGFGHPGHTCPTDKVTFPRQDLPFAQPRSAMFEDIALQSPLDLCRLHRHQAG